MRIYAVTKRWVDFLLSLILLIGLSPILAVIALCILVEDGRPILFRQRRVGSALTSFTILKFRSMPVGVANVSSANAESLPVTRVGRIIRRTSLDELPQLINILRGDMSIIGPRPALPTQIELLQARNTNGSAFLRPGLTGLAQVNGFEGMTESEKAAFDGLYLRRENLREDVNILWKTFCFLLRPAPRV
jgi:lipopolysaccharide/colanic/teichoic acid biosynthesis glycosyltransferase